MKWLAILIWLVVAGVAGLGFYRGWFTASSGETVHGVNVSVGVNQDKTKDDGAAVKEKFQGSRGAAKETATGQTGTARDRRP